MKPSVVLFMLGTLLLCSCQDPHDSQKGFADIRLYERLDVSQKDMDPSIVQVLPLIPLELTERSILGEYCEIVDDSLDRLVINDMESVYLFDGDGRFLSAVSQRGEGPHQYYNIFDVDVDWEKRHLYVFDFPSRRQFTYRMDDGGFIRRSDRDRVDGMKRLGRGNWVVYHTPGDTVTFDLCVYNEAGNRIWGMPGSAEGRGTDYQALKSFYQSNGGIYVYENDTIFRVGQAGGLSPFAAIDKGGLGIPSEVLYDIKRKGERSEYIWGESFCFSSVYCFIRYYYDNCVYSDVWNMSDGKLLYRNTVRSPQDKMGFPVRVKDSIVYVWPSFVKGDVFYCMVGEGTVAELFPEKGEEVNPCILKFRISPANG